MTNPADAGDAGATSPTQPWQGGTDPALMDAPLAAAFAPPTDLSRPAVSLAGPGPGSGPAGLAGQLRRRLRYIGLTAVAAFGYFAALTVLAPGQRVGLFLEHPSAVAANWLVLAVCAALTARLWFGPPLSLGRLRAVELGLFGAALLEMAAGIFVDLFVDHELRQPLAEGEHALFHFASSWSLPFFALIVAYGTLVPSTWRRCALVVGPTALVPVGLAAAAGAAEGALSAGFLRSFLLQIAAWMAVGVGIAAYGAHRLESLRRAARRLGQYRLLRRLGAGGMGEVYLAEHVLLKRPCALKAIRPEWAGDPEFRACFEREARLTALLTHPNTVQVFDYGRAECGTFYYVMEYLPGPTLDELVRRAGPQGPARVVRLLRQVAGSLREAHAAGLVHRDVKPANVIVCDRGGVADVAKLLDFGLAQPPDPGGARRVAGTPQYMAPEQAAGRPVDARGDVYSLGAVAYFALTGRPPFGRASHSEARAALGGAAPPPRGGLPAGVPDDLAAVVLRCLEEDQARRFGSAEELDQALARCEPPANAGD